MISLIVDPQDKRFVTLYFEKQAVKRIYRSCFRQHFSHLRQSESLADLEKRFAEVEKKVALAQAIKLLSVRSHFASALREKLQRKELSLSAIEHALRYCKQQGYLDDENEGLRFVDRLLEKGYGPLIIEAKLQRRGIREKELLLKLVHYAREHQAKALSIFLRKHSVDDKKKLIAKLMRRGFSWDLVADIFN